MALTLLRHTRPAVSGVCYGASDVALAPGFAAEAAAVLDRLAPAARLVTSPLGRCRRLADLLATRWQVPLAVDARWQEMDFGRWEGLSWDAVPRPELDLWAADLHDARPHGGESVAMLLDRVRAALATIAADTLVVTHAGPIRAALVATGDADGWRRDVPFGGTVTLAAT